MTNQPLHDPEKEQLQSQQVALKQLLESAFPPAFPSESDLEKTIQWIAGNIDKGLCRVYVVNTNKCLDEEGCKRLLERVSQRIDDPQLIKLLKEILAASSQPNHASQKSLVSLLADIAFEGIDQILQQAKALGREGNFLHVQSTRVGNQLVVLSDRDPRYDWILPAVQQRLREELSNLQYDPAAIETQSLDMTCGQPLCFLDFELRCAQGKHGETKVQYRLMEEAGRHEPQNRLPKQRRRWENRLLKNASRYLDWISSQQYVQMIPAAFLKLKSIEFGLRHVPITLYPVLALLFGWCSPVALLCALLIPICNWRAVAALVLQGWRFRAEVVPAVFGIAALLCLLIAINEVFADRSREVPAPSMPPGFYMGQYNRGLPWETEPTPYGLYVPPHFKGEKGPFPLIVFLNGYGERTKDRILTNGLAGAIAQRFGQDKPNGRFEFIVFFPVEPTGNWQIGSFEVEAAMQSLDYVMERHHIDPPRVYLSGISSGGNGVWRLAEAYPDKWAAVAPVSSFVRPDVKKVRHIPAWIFHGAEDTLARAENDRILVQQLKEANADVRYTELPNKGHVFWRMYESKELYDWLATKKKG